MNFIFSIAIQFAPSYIQFINYFRSHCFNQFYQYRFQCVCNIRCIFYQNHETIFHPNMGKFEAPDSSCIILKLNKKICSILFNKINESQMEMFYVIYHLCWIFFNHVEWSWRRLGVPNQEMLFLINSCLLYRIVKCLGMKDLYSICYIRGKGSSPITLFHKNLTYWGLATIGGSAKYFEIQSIFF